MDALKNALTSNTIRFNLAFLALLPVGPDIVQVLIETLPMLKPYLSEYLAEKVGLFVVLGNMYLQIRTVMRLRKK